MSETKLYSVLRAAKELNTTPRTVQRWIEAGKFPGAYKLDPELSNSPYVIPAAAVEQMKRARAGPDGNQKE